MTTVKDYLDWRGDIPFSVDPFNEVDNVLLSLFAYVDLENVLEEGECLPIGRQAEDISRFTHGKRLPQEILM